MRYCGVCGSPISGDARFCPYCGANAASGKTDAEPSAEPAQSLYEPYAPKKAAPDIDSLERDFLPGADSAPARREEVSSAGSLPEKYRPLSHWEYFGLALLLMVPVIGWIFMFVLSFRNSNVNRRNFAMSFLCFFLLFGIVALIVSLFFAEQFADLLTKLSDLF